MSLRNLRELVQTSSRALHYSRRFAVLVVLTLTLPLAAVLFALHLFYQLLLAPLPYPNAEQLHLVRGLQYNGDKLVYPNLMTAAGTAELYQQQFNWSQRPASQTSQTTQTTEPAIAEAALLAYGTEVLRERADSPQVRVAYTSPEYFSLLQTPFALGRSLASQTLADKTEGSQPAIDASAPAEPEVVISHRLWQQLFAGSSQVLGQQLQIGLQRFKVVGVLAANFVEPAILTPDQQTDVWLPWAINPTYQQYRNWWGALAPDHHLLVQLKPEINPALLAEQLSNLLNAKYLSEVRQSPYAAHFTDARIGVSLQPLPQVLQHQSRNFSQYLLGGCLLLLFIALVNVSQLLLARMISQQPQQAVQLALGAQPVQLARQQTMEISLLLLLATALAGFFVAVALPWFQQAAHGYVARLAELRLQTVLLLCPLALIPLIYLLNRLLIQRWNYAKLQQQLQRSGKGSSGQQHRQAGMLLGAHGFFATTLLLVSLVLATNAWQKLQPIHGFNLAGVQQIQLNYLSADGKSASVADLTAIRDLLDQQIAGTQLANANTERTQHAALAYSPVLEFQGLSVQDSLQWPQAEPNTGSLRLESSYSDSQFAALLQMPLLSGHWPERKLNDQPQQLQLLINLSAARRLLHMKPNNSANLASSIATLSPAQIAQALAGQSMLFNGDTPASIVAVVADYQLPSMSAVENADEPRVWINHFFHLLPSVYLRYPTKVTPLSANSLNQLLASINPAFKVQQIYRLDDRLQSSQRLPRLTLLVALVLSVLAGTLAGTGISAVYSYQVQLLQYQLGVRRALGASPIAILRQLVKRLLLPVATGSFVAITCVLLIEQHHPLAAVFNWESSLLWTSPLTLMKAGFLFITLIALCFMLIVRLNHRLHRQAALAAGFGQH